MNTGADVLVAPVCFGLIQQSPTYGFAAASGAVAHAQRHPASMLIEPCQHTIGDPPDCFGPADETARAPGHRRPARTQAALLHLLVVVLPSRAGR